MTAPLTSRGQYFRHHHAAAHANRGENRDPTGTLFAGKQIEKGLDLLPAIREQNPRLQPRVLGQALLLGRTPGMAGQGPNAGFGACGADDGQLFRYRKWL
jgi:hypothetical protein